MKFYTLTFYLCATLLLLIKASTHSDTVPDLAVCSPDWAQPHTTPASAVETAASESEKLSNDAVKTPLPRQEQSARGRSFREGCVRSRVAVGTGSTPADVHLMCGLADSDGYNEATETTPSSPKLQPDEDQSSRPEAPVRSDVVANSATFPHNALLNTHTHTTMAAPLRKPECWKYCMQFCLLTPHSYACRECVKRCHARYRRYLRRAARRRYTEDLIWARKTYRPESGRFMGLYDAE